MTTQNPFEDFYISWDQYCGMDDKDMYEAYQRLLKTSADLLYQSEAKYKILVEQTKEYSRDREIRGYNQGYSEGLTAGKSYYDLP